MVMNNQNDCAAADFDDDGGGDSSSHLPYLQAQVAFIVNVCVCYSFSDACHYNSPLCPDNGDGDSS